MTSIYWVLITLAVFSVYSCCNASGSTFVEYKNGKFGREEISTTDESSPMDHHGQLEMRKRWHGQAGQEQVVAEIFRSKPKGYFVDLAANHFIHLSNTYTLEQDFNWTGVCIEPNPMYRHDLVTKRSCTVSVNPIGAVTGEKVTFRMKHVFGGIVGASMDNKEEDTADKSGDTTLTLVTLSDLLDYVQAPKRIDYFSLDVEGAEALVLEGVDFSKYTFLVLSIERPTAAIHEQLTKNGFWFFRVLSSWGDVIYLHEDLPGLADWMATEVAKEGDLRTPRWKRSEHSFLTKPFFWDTHTFPTTPAR